MMLTLAATYAGAQSRTQHAELPVLKQHFTDMFSFVL